MTVATPSVPVEALEHCRVVTRRRARNFYYGLKLLPEPKRSALYAIYAWMRRADDIVDGEDASSGDCVERIESFRRQTDETIAGRPADDDPLWPALAYAAGLYPLSPEHFHDLLEGQLDDLRLHEYATFDALVEYCHRVASTVGLLCIEVWGYDDPRAVGLARDRGIAFQLTNIIRDFNQDFDEGRVYLPLEDFRAAGLEPRDLRAWTDADAGVKLIRGQAERAMGYYERSAPLDALISEDSRPALWAMTEIYRSLLEKARDDPARVVTGPRLRLSSLTKAGIAMRAKWMSYRNGGGGGGSG